jgi:hypothetical protein
MREVPISCGFLAFSAVAATPSRFRIVSAILFLFVNGSEILVVAGRDKDATQIWLSEAKALLAEGYGGASRLAEKLLQDEGAAGRLPWGYVRKNGDAADDEFWRYARIDFEENSARVGYTFFVVGPGVGPDGGTRSTEYLGIWVSRAHVLAMLPGAPTVAEVPTPASASPQWYTATTRRLLAENRIPDDAKKKKAELARLLEAEAQRAMRAGQLSRAHKASYLEDQLKLWGIWPLSSLK